jgi:hypothetical protein
MDNVGIVVDDRPATIAFFRELGLELEGQAVVEGEWAGRVIGLGHQCLETAMMRTPDGHGRVERGPGGLLIELAQELRNVRICSTFIVVGSAPRDLETCRRCRAASSPNVPSADDPCPSAPPSRDSPSHVCEGIWTADLHERKAERFCVGFSTGKWGVDKGGNP